MKNEKIPLQIFENCAKRKPKMKDDHITCLPYACLLGKNSLPARKQCIVVGRNTPKRSRFHLHIYILGYTCKVGIAAGIKSK